MKAKELREWNDEELRAELDRLRRHLFDIRTQAVTEKLEDPSLLTKARRDVARILTEQNRRERDKRAAQPAK
jgi:large subunit ribosomal protein L29